MGKKKRTPLLSLSPDVRISITAVMGNRTAIFGISGSGKSNTATVIMERLLAEREQIILIDPKGEGHGLLSLTNGKPSNLDIIVFGEPHGHIDALKEDHANYLADFVVDSGRSVVLSLLGFESDSAERRFVARFLRQLYRRKTKQQKRSRMLVVIDEAHLFVPESGGQGFKGDVAELAGACQRVVRQGRSFGIGTLLVDQRPQDVAKRVLTQCRTIICHQLTHNRDCEALADWVEGYGESERGERFLASLASLQPGAAWVWSPHLGIFQQTKIFERTTFDTGAAPDGKHSKRLQRAEVDMNRLQGQLDAVVQEVKANDVSLLKQRILQLEKQVKTPPAVPTKVVPATVVHKKMPKAEVTAIAKRVAAEACRPVFQSYREFQRLLQRLMTQMEPITSQVVIVRDFKLPELAVAVPDQPAPTPPAPQPKLLPPKLPPQPSRSEAAPAKIDTNGRGPGRCERAILGVLFQHPEGCEKGKLSLLSGYSYNGSFRTALAYLRSAQLIAGGNEEIMRITALGLGAGQYEPLPPGRLVDHWIGRFDLCPRKILSALLQTPDGMDANDLATATGYPYNGSFRTALSTLRTAGVVVGRNTETMKASQFLLDSVGG